jgi:hypothetical protein
MRLMLPTRAWDHLGVAEDLNGWYRAGGREMQFYATDEEIAEWLVATLPVQYAPYVILREEWAHPRMVVHPYALDDVAASFTADRSARHWIQSKVLSPELGPREVRRPDDLGKLSFRGLVAIRVMDEFGGRMEPASMTMIDRIRHEATGEERRQPEYLRIFERLRRSMRKRLVVKTEGWPSTERSAVERARLPAGPP